MFTLWEKIQDLVQGNVRGSTNVVIPPDAYGKLLAHLLIKTIPHPLHLVIFVNLMIKFGH